MKIAVQDIPAEGCSYAFHGRDWLPDEVNTIGEVRAELHLRRDGARILVAGALDLKVSKSCDRCLADFVLPLTTPFQIDFDLEGNEQQGQGAQLPV